MTEAQRRILIKLADPIGWLVERIGDIHDALRFVFGKNEKTFPL